MKLSIVIPSFNQGQYLEETLNSIISQKRQKIYTFSHKIRLKQNSQTFHKLVIKRKQLNNKMQNEGRRLKET